MAVDFAFLLVTFLAYLWADDVEAKAQNKCFKTIAVLASEKTRIERITKRDNITVEEAKKRLSSQFSEDYFKSNCDFVIYNNDEDDIDREIDDILHSLGF